MISILYVDVSRWYEESARLNGGLNARYGHILLKKSLIAMTVLLPTRRRRLHRMQNDKGSSDQNRLIEELDGPRLT